MRSQRRGARKRIVAPDGSAIMPTDKPQPDSTLVKALARAWRWQRMLDEGVYTSVSDIGDTEVHRSASRPQVTVEQRDRFRTTSPDSRSRPSGAPALAESPTAIGLIRHRADPQERPDRVQRGQADPAGDVVAAARP